MILGGGQEYLKTGGFSSYLYERIGEPFFSNGLKGEMITKKGVQYGHSALPAYSNTSDVYFRPDESGKACQAKVYTGRTMVLDFDWSHSHTNKCDGRQFAKGVIHVQQYKFIKIDEKGRHVFKRMSNEARCMNNAEMKLYRPMIKHFCPTIKFR